MNSKLRVYLKRASVRGRALFPFLECLPESLWLFGAEFLSASRQHLLSTRSACTLDTKLDGTYRSKQYYYWI